MASRKRDAEGSMFHLIWTGPRRYVQSVKKSIHGSLATDNISTYLETLQITIS
ncbi:hypothetical protein KP509_36G029100 [Ceratopteris richardii]|uniref:Uncharacterized protein n=1 Tax=Ceratopteris richardii TaxID=49495 RepID=A0A8T2QC66_CERRI|nr:hypothetical protein KP509_36G029100 [Ceratopteris richardii]